MIKTRFAPSPTGELHVGGARTALFSYLFAKNRAGEFLLRIEDTDRERFVEGATERIIDSLKWLGIVADNINQPIVQSKRLDLYRKAAFDLVNAGKAYICTCSKEKLAADRERQKNAGLPPRYEGHCRDAKIDLKTLADGCYTVRMKMPQSGKIIVNDLIRGKVEFDAALQDDQIILKSDGFPTYHLASVIDDFDSKITHVIRSEEWLSSTPKHLILYEMFGWPTPEFAHLSMILGHDHSKLSKRHGATSIIEYKKLGYLSEALVNFMALLGWNPKDEREIFSLTELTGEFSLDNVNKSDAIFDIEKLNYFNSERLKNLPFEKLKKLIGEFGISDPRDGELALIQRGGYKTVKEAADYIIRLRENSKYDPQLLIFKKSDKEKTLVGLQAAADKLSTIASDWTEENLQEILESVVADNNLSNGDVFWPIRVALSGEEKSPSPIELLLALGKDESIKRITKAIHKSG
ncbi:glutamate--tRNA ligase [Candidatus Berkelbacteria bacterium CG08_land_8_20_14_0_20_39_8]|uniref:Glutamate--tRNA ligase n=1 Tax=Candidatus Berkelbacteria bacterium CG08_land_8_20_14_0_20_39_8 TaxID=1974511 RepID=A0A2M6YD25_9BACT|nr:MAG: glutamate--tRNA ligase [Candidatus Berkelbacteria bacterium CG08_land_8_20_14_0_20_39_8]